MLFLEMWLVPLFYVHNSQFISQVYYPKNDDRHTMIHVHEYT